MAKLLLNDVRKSYGNTRVLHGVNMDIADGEFVVIVGPSGCGKSSLLRMVAGLEEVSEGEIRIGERRVNDLEPAERDIAMVFQNYALYPHMTVRDNMAYGLKIRGLSASEIEQRVQTAAATLELGHLLDRKPRQLSGGQRQRVAMGRAIVREPAVFLFDEPLSNLDAKLRVQMRLELELLHQRLKTTSLYVTHDQIEALTLADRMMVLNAGKVEQIGTPHEVYTRPASVFVATFIGSPPMNLLPAGNSSGQLRLAQENLDNKPLLSGISCPRQQDGLLFGFRPEHAQPCAPEQASAIVSIRLIESLGADAYAYCKLGEHDVTVRLPGEHGLHHGDSLPIHIATGVQHWFDAGSGQRLED